MASPPPIESSSKASTGTRALALLIDEVIAWVLGLLPVIGYVISAAYFVLQDEIDVDFMRGRSLGKRLMNLHPTRLDGKPMDLETSLKRNWMLGLGAVGALLIDLPYVGWLMIPIDYPTELSIPFSGSASMRMDRARRQKMRNFPDNYDDANNEPVHFT